MEKCDAVAKTHLLTNPAYAVTQLKEKTLSTVSQVNAGAVQETISSDALMTGYYVP